ncbi:MAG: GNAT family N-acetyltransferase [Burkholderiaceae bacterium]|nr:GNAT family N-acetyltransferase [Burkholderiaceae bacterium]
MRSAPPGHAAIDPALLAGRRVRLRQWTGADHAPFAALNADPVAMEFFQSTLTRELSDALAERITARSAERGWGLWAADHLPPDGSPPQFMGFIGLSSPVADLPFKPRVEIGWRLLGPYWGQGLASFASSALATGAKERQCMKMKIVYGNEPLGDTDRSNPAPDPVPAHDPPPAGCVRGCAGGPRGRGSSGARQGQAHRRLMSRMP